MKEIAVSWFSPSLCTICLQTEARDEKFTYQQVVQRREEVAVKALPIGIVEAFRRRKAMLGSSLLVRDGTTSAQRPRSVATGTKRMIQSLALKHQQEKNIVQDQPARVRTAQQTPDEYLESVINTAS